VEISEEVEEEVGLVAELEEAGLKRSIHQKREVCDV